MHDGNIAGEQVGKLRQEQRRPQVAHQPLVEEGAWVFRVLDTGEDGAVDGEIALAAAGGDDHVHARENVGLALDAGGVERKTGSIGADALPILHLALIALLRDLGVEIDWRQRMHDVRREGRCVGAGMRFHQFLPMRLRAFAEAGDDADAGDPGFARSLSHRRAPRPSVQSGLQVPASAVPFRHWGNRARAASAWRRKSICARP